MAKRKQILNRKSFFI